ncbi:phosphatases II [Rhizoclosmatium globosum]|uniref:Phosphatases II n=1 Tax=Rhizoclosmatium globosum TaxID=329046 RepID=A0A1Y2A1F5_9FUNG|nr:phosphatases II [Rhizoclosmatium globosum]|eukprot:ORY16326.1 phosphatases II [Rhizoclosmatium globosum]
MDVQLKHAVSQGKRRTIDRDLGIDLDLAYMTSTLIAMGFPSSTFPKRIYRNSMKQTLKYLDAKHKDKYKVYNLCSEPGFSYPPESFHSNWVSYPFDDHTPPQFSMLLAIVRDIREWMRKNEGNVAVVHCKAGKGRTGVVCCAVMIAEGVFEDAESCLRGYTGLRMREGFGEGLTVAGQVRWVRYFDEFVRGFGRTVDGNIGEISGSTSGWNAYRIVERKIGSVTVHGIKGKRDIVLEFLIDGKLHYSTTAASINELESGPLDTKALVYTPQDSVALSGDICMRVKSNSQSLCRIWFNTHFAGFDKVHPHIQQVEFKMLDADGWKPRGCLDAGEFRLILEFE